VGVKVQFRRGAWWVVIHHASRRKMKRVGDRQTALRVAQAVRERLARGDFDLAPPSGGSPTLRTYSEGWLRTAKTALKASTIAFYEENLARHIWPMLGAPRLIAAPRGLPGLGD
jgi:hypothetical protein